FQGTVWASDSFTGVVVRYNPSNGDRIEIIGSTARPGAIAVDPLKHTAWVCDERQSAVLQFTLSGAPGSPAAVGPVGLPLGVAVERRITGFPEVREIAVDLDTGNAWATVPGDGRVVVVSPDGSLVAQLGGFVQPYAIALDPGSPLAVAARAGAHVDMLSP